MLKLTISKSSDAIFLLSYFDNIAQNSLESGKYDSKYWGRLLCLLKKKKTNWIKIPLFIKIELPLAFPHIMLGVNQTVVFALFMVIIGAFIGTDDLGQYILKALSDKQGTGNGITLGLCVAFIGLAVDNLIRTWAAKRRVILGLD